MIRPRWSFQSAALRYLPYIAPCAVLLATWLPGCNQGWFRTDSHYYTAVSLQALQGGFDTLWKLHAGELPYLNKPPLAFWIHAAFLKLIGVSLVAVRFPALLAALGTVCATVYAVRQLSGWRVALLAGFILSVSVEFFRYTRAYSLDLWMVLFMMLAVAMVCRAVRTGRPGLIVAAGLPIGLALMTKPFVGLIAPLLWSVWFASSGRARWLVHCAGAIAIALVVAAPWHVSMAIEYPGVFIDNYLMKQSVDRAVGPSGEPWWFYFRVLGETYWPWTATTVLSLVALARAGIQFRRQDARLIVLAGLWCVVWLVALSLFGGKAGRYLAPVLPMLAVPSAVWLVRRPQTRKSRRIGAAFFRLGPMGAVAVSAVLLVAGLKVHEKRNPAWDDAAEILARNPGVPVYCTGRAHSMSASLVLLGRPWPVTWDGAALLPPDSILVMHNEETPPAGSTELMNRNGVMLRRIGVR